MTPVLRRSESDELRAGWATLLGEQPWDIFATLTFKHPIHDPTRCVHMARAWVRRWHLEEAVVSKMAQVEHVEHRDAYGRLIGKRERWSGSFVRKQRRGRQRPVWCIAVEEHKSGALHMHAVLRQSIALPTMLRRRGSKVWREELGDGGLGMCRIEAPRNQDDVRGYVAKYVTKEGELYLSDSFETAPLLMSSTTQPHAA